MVKISIFFKLENEPSILENTTVPSLESIHSHSLSLSLDWKNNSRTNKNTSSFVVITFL